MTIDAPIGRRPPTAEFPWDLSRRTSARDLWRAALAGGEIVSAPSIPRRASGHAQEISARTVPLLAVMAEFIVMAAATFGAGSLYHHVVIGTLPSPLFYLVATMALSALYVAQCALARDHSVRRLLEPKDELRSVFVRWNSAFSLFVFALFMSQATDFYSRGSIVAQYVAGLAVAGIVRVMIMGAVARGLRSGRIRGRKAVVVGERSLLESLLPRLSRPGSGASIVDVIALEENFDLRSGRTP